MPWLHCIHNLQNRSLNILVRFQTSVKSSLPLLLLAEGGGSHTHTKLSSGKRGRLILACLGAGEQACVELLRRLLDQAFDDILSSASWFEVAKYSPVYFF